MNNEFETSEDVIIEKIDTRRNLLNNLGMLTYLPARTVRVIEMRFGLDDGNEKTSEAIGEILSLTSEQVKKIEDSGLDQLRGYCSHQGRLALKNVLGAEQAPEHLPPVQSDLDKVYSFIPDSANAELARSLQPDSFSLGGYPLTTKEKQWLYALRLFSVDQKKLKQHLANSIFKCSLYMIATRFGLLTGELFLKSYEHKNDIWNDVVYAGLEQRALEHLLPIKKEHKRLKNERKKMDAKLSVAYSFIPDANDAKFARSFEPNSFVLSGEDCNWERRWVYALFFLGPRDKKGRQELMQYLADSIFNCPVSDVAEIAACLSEEYREEFRKKGWWFIDYAIKEVERRKNWK